MGLRSGQVGQFSTGGVGQFYSGANSQSVSAALIEQRQRTKHPTVQQPIGNEVHGPNLIWPICAAHRNPTNVLRSAPRPAFRNLQILEPVKAPKSLVVHVRIPVQRLAFIGIVQALAARARPRLRQLRNALNQRSVLERLRAWLFIGRAPSRVHDLAGFALAQSSAL
jgi:hypothetical protein